MIPSFLVCLVLVLTGSPVQQDGIKVITLPSTPTNGSQRGDDDLLIQSKPNDVRFPVPGEFERQLTNIISPEDFDRIKSALGLEADAATALGEAFRRYSESLSGVAQRMGEVCGTRNAPFEGRPPETLDGDPAAVTRLAEARERAGKEADARMAAALETLDREAVEILGVAKSEAWRAHVKAWRRKTQLQGAFSTYPPYQDFAQDVDLTEVARRLSTTNSQGSRWFDPSAADGLALKVENGCEDAKGIHSLMSAYVQSADQYIMAKLAARDSWRRAGIAASKGDAGPQTTELERSRNRWVSFTKNSLNVAKRIEELLRACGDAELATAWNDAVLLTLCPGLYGKDALDLAHEWLARRRDLPAQTLQAIDGAYQDAVRKRQELRPQLMKEMLDAVASGEVKSAQVGSYRRWRLSERFVPLMDKRNEALAAGIEAWRKILPPDVAAEMDSFIARARNNGQNGGPLDY